MKKFLIKFIILFALIDGILLYYVFAVYPQLSGDMGHMGQITFGTAYMDSLQNLYAADRLRVHNLQDIDSINISIVTIGDSFSHFKEYGYSQAIAELLNTDIIDISVSDDGPLQTFVQYANNNLFPPHTIVIVESVERSLLGRIQNIDLTDTSMPKIQAHTFVTADKNAPKKKPDYLTGTIKYIRRLLHFQRYNSIHLYNTNVNLFSHPQMSNQLYIYDSPWDGDGDFRYRESRIDNYSNIYNKLYDIHHLASEHNIHFIFLVATDKYDVYEPFIIANHETNPTLDSIPSEDWIVNSKPFLQDAAFSGVKDIYYINDTHWSPVGAKIVGEEIVNRLRKLGFIQ